MQLYRLQNGRNRVLASDVVARFSGTCGACSISGSWACVSTIVACAEGLCAMTVRLAVPSCQSSDSNTTSASAPNARRVSPKTSNIGLFGSLNEFYLIGTNFSFHSRTSRAVCQEAKHSIVWLHLDEERGRLLSLGHDRVMKIWDLNPLLKSDI